MKRATAALVLLLAIVSGACVPDDDSPAVARGTPPKGSPNFLILLTDDQSFRLFDRSLMPRAFADLVDQGVDFTRAYVNVPLCCPSRATILTGLYAHHTGVDTNSTRLEGGRRARPTFVRALYEAGYRTMLAGKYLNSETCAPRPEWDRWACSKGGGQVDPTLNIDGRSVPLRGYTTDLLADRVIDFITDARAEGRPFFAYYAPATPHEPANDPRARSMRIPFHDAPSYDAQPDQPALPRWVRRDTMPQAAHDAARGAFERMAQQMPPFDAALGRILDSLGPDAENTFVLLMSDNGYLYGEHRLGGKGLPYEESVRVPFVVRYPRLLPRERRFSSSTLVSNADVAATIMDLAGIPWAADGRSLVPVVSRREPSVREELLIEWCTATRAACTERPEHKGGPPIHRGIESDRYVYIEYETGEAELYDLRTDPFQLRNLAAVPAAASIRSQLAARLAQLLGEPPVPETTIASGPVGEIPQTSVSFEFFSPALSTGFACRLEGPNRSDEWQRCDQGRLTFRSLSRGTYLFLVRAVDEHGATDPTPAERGFEVTS